jgi:hypothetical protein
MRIVQGVRWITTSAGPARLFVVTVAFALLTGLALVPLAMAKVPFMFDYVNHLTGVYAIAHYENNPLIAQYYFASWQLVPSLGMNLLLYPFAKVMNIYLLGKLFVAFLVLLMVVGVFAVERAIHQQTTVWPLTTFLFVLGSWMISWGTLNYVLGVSIALYAFAAHLAVRDRLLYRFACSLAFCALLFVVHLFALGLYGLAILSFEIWRLSANRDWRRWVKRMAITVLPFLMVMPLFLLTPTRELAGASGTHWSGPRSKAEAVYAIFQMYRWEFDVPFLIVALSLAMWALWTRRLRVHAVGWIMLGISIPVFLAMPLVLLDSYGADQRFPIGVLLVVLGMCAFKFRQPWHSISFAAIIVSAMAYRIATMIVVIETEFVPLSQHLETSFEEMEPGRKVLVTLDKTSESRIGTVTLYRIAYAPTLAIIQRSAFVSTAYATLGHHVLAAQPPYRHLVAAAYPRNIDINEVLLSPKPGRHYSTWKTEYDYVYVLYPSRPLNDPNLQLVYRGDQFFDMYKVVH